MRRGRKATDLCVNEDGRVALLKFFNLKGIIMKKAMLFVVSFFFAVSVNAATLNLSLDGTGGFFGGATQSITANNSNDVGAVGKGAGISWFSDFSLVSNKTTKATIDFKAIGGGLIPSLSEISILFGDANNLIAGGSDTSFLGVFDFNTTVMLTAGTQYFFFIDGVKNVTGYNLQVSAVPIPAALWLFAPALLGLLGLRRKAQAAIA